MYSYKNLFLNISLHTVICSVQGIFSLEILLDISCCLEDHPKIRKWLVTMVTISPQSMVVPRWYIDGGY